MSEKIEGYKKNSVNNIHRDYTNSDLVLGEPQGLLDTVHILHPELEDLFIKAKSQMWSGKGEFDFSPCLKEFAKQDDNADIMIDTISYQYQADSLVAKSLLPIMAPFITNSEMNCAFAFNTAMECLHPDHEIYIKGKGWVSIKDAKQGDEVLQFVSQTTTLEFAPVLGTIAKENSHDHLFILKDQRHFEQHVTPNHRIPFKRKPKSMDNVLFTEATKLNIGDKNVQIFLSANKVGSIAELSCYDKFWIAYQADGHLPKTNGRNGVIQITFNFKKERKCIELLNIINECGYDYAYNKDVNGYNKYHVRVPLEHIRNDAKNFGWVDLDNVDANYAREFLLELYKWDGHRKTEDSFAYYSSREGSIDVVKTLCSFAGFRYSMVTSFPGDNSFRKKPCYRLSINDRNIKDTFNMTKITVPYTGMVYCIRVPSGAFLTRINGRISITGNCEHSIAYSEMIKTSFTDPEAILKKIIESQETADRMSKVEDVLEELYHAGLKYSVGNMSKDEAFPIVYCGMTAIYLLERIQFIASFAITFGLGEAGLFLPIANCVKKICADEIGVHSLVDEYVLREMRKMKYWKHQPKEFHDNIIEIIDDVERIELEWTDFIFKDRTIVGLTPELVKDWVRFNVQMLKQSMDLPFEVKVKENPLPWMNNWLSLNKFQNAPQEIEKSDYAVGAMKDDLDDADFDA